MKSLSIRANAKINIFLEVGRKREDGYHDIESVMQTVSLCDYITLSCQSLPGITLSCTDSSLPFGEKNTAYMAAVNFFDYCGIERGAKIHIEKHIPHEAGLGGGSADAAAVINGLDILYKTNLTLEQRQSIGKKVGADVPFCITGGSCIVRGIGEIIESCPPLPDCRIIIAKKGDGISTGYAYELIDRTPKERRGITDIQKSLYDKNLKSIAGQMKNDFEPIVLPIRPKCAELKNIMQKNGALVSMMSGSGTAVFGIFEDLQCVDKASENLRALKTNFHLCHPAGKFGSDSYRFLN